MKIQPENSDPTPTPMASARGDLRQLKRNSGATVAELKAFLQELRGKSPQEMLGVVATSQLARAIGLSTALVAGAMIVFTAIPYATGGREKTEGPAGNPSAAAPAPVAPATPTPAPATPAPASSETPLPSDADLSTLGVGEEKKAPPNLNPLENKKDDFLEGLD